LKKPSIRPRHWEEVCNITGVKLPYESPDQLTIEDLYNAHLLDHEEDILDQTESADKQLKIQNTLVEINEYWQDAFFEFIHGSTRKMLMY